MKLPLVCTALVTSMAVLSIASHVSGQEEKPRKKSPPVLTKEDQQELIKNMQLLKNFELLRNFELIKNLDNLKPSRKGNDE